MIKRVFVILCITLTCYTAQAIHKLPAIRAHSKSVNIRDGGVLSINAWTITPELKPDIYTTNIRNSTVTFITDLDSITFTIIPGNKYDFLIILDEKDSAWTQINYAPGYLDLLRIAEKYNYSDQRSIPVFTYQPAENPDLTELRNAFNLDSIAGQGSEISRIINLMHWIHNLIPHDGNHDNPVVKNALSMINECRKEKRGMNCRGLATALNECYLSMGFKSRFITCFPKDSIFQDCHVINIVYSSELKKWLWMDPTNDAYVMNEKGELLSVEEVRERLIKDRPLILNPDANWNHKTTTIKEFYLYNYMAKNLYRIECPVDSEYNTETPGNMKPVSYIELLPLDAYRQSPQKKEITGEESGRKITYYKTNNPDLFWAVPK